MSSTIPPELLSRRLIGLELLTIPNPLEELLDIAAGIGANSELLAARAQVDASPENVLGLELRALRREDIAIMESRGCHCSDWTAVRVDANFDPFRMRNVDFQGRCVIGAMTGQLELEPGISLPCGVQNCSLINCQIGSDCLLENVRFAANIIVESGCVIFDVGSITCSGKATFACGQQLPLGIEVGGRELPLWAEVTVDRAAIVVQYRGVEKGIAAVAEAVDKYTRSVASPVAWVRAGTFVAHTVKIRDAYLGPSARIEHALDLSNVCILSTREEPVVVSSGASVRDSLLQWGVKVAGNGIVRSSALLEHSGVDEMGVVNDSLVGPNTSISKGEVTASLLGPFVGFHHQSLLISAFWPEGKGNIAYGAKVGSNHTGRAPDQEVWPGEGTFFGLGCSIRFPTDFSQAPYSLVASGVSSLPQRMTMPFSLIKTPEEGLAKDCGQPIPRAFNELLPGWGLYNNAYALARMENKFQKRDKAHRHKFEYLALRPAVMRLVMRALETLQSVQELKNIYMDADIRGIGKNFMRECARQKAIAAYRSVLKRYALRILLSEREGTLRIAGSAEIGHEIANFVMPDESFEERMKELEAVEHANARIVEDSKAQDDRRGAEIIPGYADAHTSAAEDPVVKAAWERARRTTARIAAVLHAAP
eukprot:TRINITY_DN12840_c0_g1_i1.p1 TRINITY_DN12840_c0_g1~~TRINITY_DN12840_c0_g1_i1.p1  ORF type:complete len:651 (-),score=96.14 TRINITY_DN12840_c0_g1_i1:31-1983(-)